MNEYDLQRMLNDNYFLESKLVYFESKNLVMSKSSISEQKGHLEKSEHNFACQKKTDHHRF